MLVKHLSSGGNEQSWFKAYTEKAIQILLKKGVQISTSGSEGGYLSVFEPNSDVPPKMEYLIACGYFPMAKWGRYMYNSTEKAFRLNENIPKGHRTSRQSKDVNNEEYPGAIYIALFKRIFSFSGLEPQWDEFISLLNSVFSYYLHRRSHEEIERLEDLPAIFQREIGIIVATEEEVGIMIETFNEVVAYEIQLRDK